MQKKAHVPKTFDWEAIRAVIEAIDDKAIQRKVAKLLKFDTDVSIPWLDAIAEPFDPSAGDADPVRVAAYLERCGYKPRKAVDRAKPKLQREPVTDPITGRRRGRPRGTSSVTAGVVVDNSLMFYQEPYIPDFEPAF